MKRKSNKDNGNGAIQMYSSNKSDDSIVKKKALSELFSSLSKDPSYLTFKNVNDDSTNNNFDSLYIDDVINMKQDIDLIPFDPVLKNGIDIEANFDLRCFMEENYYNQYYYIYPTTTLPNNVVISSNDLNAICDYSCLWTLPLETDKDIVSIIKRRKMLFQMSLLSCYEQLKLKTLDYFYITSSSNNDEQVILPGFNAFFYNSNTLDTNKLNNNIYCILVGVTIGFYRKLMSLNISPSIIEKVRNDEIYSENKLFTKSVLIEGIVNCGLVIDLINEVVFPPYKSITSRKYIDPPNIVSPKYFCNSVMKKNQINIIDCSESFNDNDRSKNKAHKIRLTGYILPNIYKSLITSLQNCIDYDKKPLIVSVNDIDNTEINDKSLKTSEIATTLIPMIIYTAKSNDKKVNQFISNKYFIIDTIFDDNVIDFAYYKLCDTIMQKPIGNNSIIIGIDWTENEFEEENYINLLNKKMIPIKLVKDDSATNSNNIKDNSVYTLNPMKEYYT